MHFWPHQAEAVYSMFRQASAARQPATMNNTAPPSETAGAPPQLKGFGRLVTWKRGDERAPHKPLLALWAIGRCLRDEDRMVDYGAAHDAMLELLERFGPPRIRHKPQEPFWRMRRDRIWEVDNVGLLINHEDKSGSVSPAALRKLGGAGGFVAPIDEFLRRNRRKALQIARELVSAHFPETMHRAVLEATLGEEMFRDDLAADEENEIAGSDLLGSLHARRRRNPAFRRTVLERYRYRCAVCASSLEFPPGNWPALEAAHIRWHSHRGPDDIRNGLSLCVLHHELFDWGAFTIGPGSFDIRVAPLLRKETGRWVGELDGRALAVQTARDEDHPAPEYLKWHAKNVFRGSEPA